MALIQLHAALLLPLFHRLWLTIGTGNANFFYAATLLFGLGNGMAILDAMWGGLRIAVGKGYEGKDIEVIQK
jgi:phosphatidylinositol glycan class U